MERDCTDNLIWRCFKSNFKFDFLLPALFSTSRKSIKSRFGFTGMGEAAGEKTRGEIGVEAKIGIVC